jgi:hypothetical protein
MSNLLDFDRLSDYINATADRKLVSIASSISSSTGYLRNLVSQSQGFSEQAAGHASNAQTSAVEADTSAATSLTVFNDFSSTYLGISTTEPQISSQGNNVNVNAFYIRRNDGRIRYVATIDGNGVPTFNDATVTADPTSLAAAGAGVFLSVVTTTQQIVRSPVTFQAPVLGTRVTSWTTQQLTTAVDVNDRIVTVQGTVTAETSRATQAENTLNNNKVAKTGDIMSGALQIAATGDNASFTLRNTTSGSGRMVRLNLQDNGVFRICDDTGTIDRLTIKPNGEVSVLSSFTAGTSIGSKNFIVSQTDNSDAGIAIHRTEVPRWYIRRSDAANRFYISRMNAQGVYVDTPFYINESDGSVVQNRTTVNDTLTATGTVTVNGIGASLLLNNTSSSNDATLQLRHNGVNRWTVGRSPSNGIFYINRNDVSGNYADTSLQISESTGVTTIRTLSVSTTVTATTSITTPIVYATANGTGRSISVGDDAWIGDINIANTLSIRGQADGNAGFVSFGNSLGTLGCNANDAQLRWNNSVVLHAGNFDSNGIVRIVAENLNEQNGFTVYSNGKKECWGWLDISANSTRTVTIPTPHTSWVNISLGSFTRNSSDAQDNTAILSKNGVVSFVIANWEDIAVRVEWSTRGV